MGCGKNGKSLNRLLFNIDQLCLLRPSFSLRLCLYLCLETCLNMILFSYWWLVGGVLGDFVTNIVDKVSKVSVFVLFSFSTSQLRLWSRGFGMKSGRVLSGWRVRRALHT